MQEYCIVGRRLPSAAEPTPQLSKMRIFAPNEIVAKSRFFFFLRRIKKIKRTAGEIVSFLPVVEESPLAVKNYGVWLRYDSRSGTHNMYKEFRAMNRAEAVATCYNDMASHHRARFSSIHIIKVAELEEEQIRRPYIQQVLAPELKFPLPHRVDPKIVKSLFAKKRPSMMA